MKLSSAISFDATLFFTTASHAAEEIKDCDACPALIVVPADEFTMGSNTKESGHPDEKPEHVVKIAQPGGVSPNPRKFREANFRTFCATTFHKWS